MKYMGSKNRISKDLKNIIQPFIKEDSYYIEPFCGGCNMIDKIEAKNRIANDSNKYLIAMWKEIIYNNWQPSFITKEEYIKIKNNKNAYPDFLIGWVGFQCSYKGKFFAGYSGKIVTSNGINRNYQLESYNNIKKQINNLKDVIFTNNNYSEIIIPDNSIIYCDPPYKSTTQYNDKNFNYNEFYEWCIKQSKRNKIFISEYEMPEKFKCIYQKKVNSPLDQINNKNTKQAIEKLFTI